MTGRSGGRRRSVVVAGALAALGLEGSAALHAIWLVSPWPLPDWPAWSRAFGSADFRVADPVMIAVAALFALAGYLVAARAALVPRIGPAWLYRWGTWGVAAVLLLRAITGFVEMPRTLANPATPLAFRETIRLYLSIYLPLFAVLGALSLYVAVRARSGPEEGGRLVE